jgi:uncharacterized repeat protein (TIGR04076 family)
MRLIIQVREIKGHCPVYHMGDRFTIDESYKLTARKKICMHSLTSLMPYYVALSNGVSPKILGLTKQDDGKAFVQCLDPCEYTGGGTVTFQITRTELT